MLNLTPLPVSFLHAFCIVWHVFVVLFLLSASLTGFAGLLNSCPVRPGVSMSVQTPSLKYFQPGNVGGSNLPASQGIGASPVLESLVEE